MAVVYCDYIFNGFLFFLLCPSRVIAYIACDIGPEMLDVYFFFPFLPTKWEHVHYTALTLCQQPEMNVGQISKPLRDDNGFFREHFWRPSARALYALSNTNERGKRKIEIQAYRITLMASGFTPHHFSHWPTEDDSRHPY